MYIKVLKSSAPEHDWYSNMIGEVFTVIEARSIGFSENPNLYFVEHPENKFAEQMRAVRKKDCEILE